MADFSLSGTKRKYFATQNILCRSLAKSGLNVAVAKPMIIVIFQS
jgi:hypothetical protein